MGVKICGRISCKKVVYGRCLVGNFKRAACSTLNRAIDAPPIELHLPGGYQYCGAETTLQERLERGGTGINGLDKACRGSRNCVLKVHGNTRRSEDNRTLPNSAQSNETTPPLVRKPQLGLCLQLRI